ncbi:hypothetical protein [Nocardia sp. NPDC058666]|uniref:DUF7373 family lipoprotein n=1 Tax=unclassified Nocardia TaxID=2637762 RepID=UPI003660ED95
MRRSEIGFGALLLVVLLSACTVPGTATSSHVDLATLDYGEYQHIPLTAPLNNDLYTGKILESVRLGEVMINPARADPLLSQGTTTMAAVPLPTPTKVSGVLSEPSRAVLTRHGMLAGFTVAGSDTTEARKLTIVALRMPDADAATKAAAELDAADAAVNADNVRVDIPEHTAAQAHWRPTVPSLAATIAAGNYVVSVLVHLPTIDLPAMTALAGKTFSAQIPELRRFVATPREALATLPIDADGMVARMVPEKPGRWSMPAVTMSDLDRIAGGKILLQPRGLAFGPNAAYLMGSRESRSTTERWAWLGLDGLLREPDAVTARAAFDRSKRIIAAEGIHEFAGPAGIEDIWCGKQKDGPVYVQYFCKIVHGRYNATVFESSEQKVRQKAAAQYSLLVRAG